MYTNKSEDDFNEIELCQKANISLATYQFNPVKLFDNLYLEYQKGTVSWEDYSNAVKHRVEAIDKSEKSGYAQIDAQSRFIKATPEQIQEVKKIIADKSRASLDAMREHIKRVESIEGKCISGIQN